MIILWLGISWTICGAFVMYEDAKYGWEEYSAWWWGPWYILSRGPVYWLIMLVLLILDKIGWGR